MDVLQTILYYYQNLGHFEWLFGSLRNHHDNYFTTKNKRWREEKLCFNIGEMYSKFSINYIKGCQSEEGDCKN